MKTPEAEEQMEQEALRRWFWERYYRSRRRNPEEHRAMERHFRQGQVSVNRIYVGEATGIDDQTNPEHINPYAKWDKGNPRPGRLRRQPGH